jgi:hypothetical protein
LRPAGVARDAVLEKISSQRGADRLALEGLQDILVRPLSTRQCRAHCFWLAAEMTSGLPA